MRHATSSAGSDPPRNLRKRTAKLIDDLGVKGACRALGVSREALARVAAGIAVRAGTLALVAGSVGSLSKVFAESIEAIDPRPVEALEAVGARQVQAVSFAVLPQALPNLVSYIMLNFEHNIRASFIVGFVGGGGLGFEVQTETGIFKYHQFLDHLIIIIVLVVLADRLSAFVRKRLV